MSNPILLVTNAGHGETPIPADALVKPGDLLAITNENDGSKHDAKIVAVVPIEYAIADQNGEPRPLAISKTRHRSTIYVIEMDGRQVIVTQEKMVKGLKAAAAREATS